MKMKKLTALFMGLALALGLTACSGRQPSNTAGNDSRSETESENSAAIDDSQKDQNSTAADSSQATCSASKHRSSIRLIMILW